MADLYEKKEEQEERKLKGCVAVTYQSATVSVPVSVKPKICTGEPNTFCCGEPKIVPYPDKDECCHSKESCDFVIRQKFCIEIPIKIDTDVFVDSPCIECGETVGETYENSGE